MDRNQRFTSEEVSAIVREALQLRHSEEAHSISYADLEDIAKQCGVDLETLEKTLQRRKIESKKQTIRREWRTKALATLAWPALACTGLVVMNILGGGFPWAIFPVMFWLLPELSRCRTRLFPTDGMLTKTAQRLETAQSSAQ